jgi:ABC-type transporter Mla subunit MlaD
MQHKNILDDRLSFVGVDKDTRKALHDYSSELRNALPPILEKFYDHVKKWPDLAKMFKDQSRMDHARSAQQEHWIKLFSGRFDDDYAQSVRRIGLIHSKIGLEPTWYIGAYAFTLNHLYQNAASQYKSILSPNKAQKKTAMLMRALNQCVMIDMDMAISIYLEENKKSYDAKLEQLAVNFESKIGVIVDGFSSAATELEASAGNLAKMAERTAEQANNVASASDEASSNVSAVSSATEEMSASINQVAGIANRSSDVSQSAENEADQSVHIMAQLGESIERINSVTDLITGIAEQTNLLALNATIEAARAGEAGKGFAVVASEVKALATQTSKATEDIRAQITDVLSRSKAAAQSIEAVKNSIADVRASSVDTASAVDQQKDAVMEIARNVEQASIGTRDISSNVVLISQAAQETGNSAEQVLGAVTELAMQSANLRTEVGKFIEDIKAKA